LVDDGTGHLIEQMRLLHAKAYAEVENEDKRKAKQIAVSEAAHATKQDKPGSVSVDVAVDSEGEASSPARIRGNESPTDVRQNQTTDNRTKESQPLFKKQGVAISSSGNLP